MGGGIGYSADHVPGLLKFLLAHKQELQLERKMSLETGTEVVGLPPSGRLWYHDQHIHITVGSGLAGGVGTK